MVMKKPLKTTLLISTVFLILGFLISLFVFKDKIYETYYISEIVKPFKITPLKIETVTQKIVSEEDIVSNVVEKVQDSVVSINYLNPKNSKDENPLGSGVVISKEGLIITNKHVVDSDRLAYEVVFQNGQKYEVTEIIRDKVKDLALLKIEANDLNPVTISESKIKLGQKAIAVGNSLGFSNTVSAGIISGLGREVEINGELFKDLIQTDAAINPGNSGGALLNSSGELIGINTARSEEGDNVGFAIPVSNVLNMINNFKTGALTKNSQPAFLGITFEFKDLGDYVRKGLPIGPVITSIVKNSPADNAELKTADIIISIDGTEFSDENELSEFIKSKNAGDAINLKIYRNGESLNIRASLTAFPK